MSDEDDEEEQDICSIVITHGNYVSLDYKDGILFI